MASLETITREIQALKAHYRTAAMSEEQEVRWLQDYAQDLAPFSDRSVVEACRRWRNTDAKSMPKVGELTSLARTHQAFSLTVAREPEAPREWVLGCITDGEYADMTLRQKAREQRMRARYQGLEATKRMNRHLPESRQSDAYWFHRSRERDALAEAQRLESLAHAQS